MKIDVFLKSSLLAMSAYWLASGAVHAQSLPPPERPIVDDNGVDIANGDIQYSIRDISIGPDDLFGLSYERYYSGGAWRDNFFNEIVTEQFFSGERSTYAKFGNFYEPFSHGMPLSATGSSASSTSVTLKDGTYMSFTNSFYYYPPDSNGYSKEWNIADYLEKKNGVRWTVHHKKVTISGVPVFRIQSITSNTGYQLKFNYESSALTDQLKWRSIVSVVAINNAYEYCDPAADTCSLSGSWKSASYSTSFAPGNGGGNFQATNASGDVTVYARDSTYFKVRTPDSGTYNIVYTYPYVGNICGFSHNCQTNNGNRVSSVSVNGEVANYSYSYNSGTDKITLSRTGSLSSSDTYVINPALWVIDSHRNSLLKTTSYEYYFGMLSKTTLPEGNYISQVLNASGNPTQTTARAKAGSPLADLVETKTFGACAQPTSITDPRGNLATPTYSTTYTYSATHCGVLTETGPAVGGIAPVKRYSYAQRYAWIKNSGGSYVQAATPVWVKTEERMCRTTATVSGACSGGSSDEVVTAYDYGPNSGPNNLLVRGVTVTADSTTLRTCFGYDVYGNKISETKPRAGLSSCP